VEPPVYPCNPYSDRDCCLSGNNCWIDDVCYGNGVIEGESPNEACLWCDVSKTKTAWSPRPSSSVCEVNTTCYGGSLLEGCNNYCDGVTVGGSPGAWVGNCVRSCNTICSGGEVTGATVVCPYNTVNDSLTIVARYYLNGTLYEGAPATLSVKRPDGSAASGALLSRDDGSYFFSVDSSMVGTHTVSVSIGEGAFIRSSACAFERLSTERPTTATPELHWSLVPLAGLLAMLFLRRRKE